ncbi:MAG: Indole-3-glycerol phosphate synthase [Methanoregulaceae archaeon PtaU1.Bin222]|nr:MAG: Indole-3-glycerol phosphate synthase [Methanoregulaceae archaeon PtaU1.Bin222]
MILDEIVAATKARIAGMPAPSHDLDHVSMAGSGLYKVLKREEGHNAIISEIKFGSPSRGVIKAGGDAASLARMMVSSGCSALSVITEPDFFHGNSALIPEIRPFVEVPILRKDFIIDERQIAETRELGADSVLLIAGILGEHLADFVDLAVAHSLEPFVETHTLREVHAALDSGTRIVGINNRNLLDFSVDLSTTRRLAPFIREAGCKVVSESGFVWPYDVRSMRNMVDGFLIGSAVMSAPDPAKRLEGFVSA